MAKVKEALNYEALSRNDQESATGSSEAEEMEPPRGLTRNQKVTVTVLTFVNLINYMDRYTIASMLRDIQKEYQITDSQAGALQTAFVISYMIFAPIFGYLGDRYSRKKIMALGIAMWVAATMIGSFMPDYNSFLLMRAIVGIGEASYSTIAPTIISDLFVKEVRSKMLAIFYFAIPVGSGLGYVVGRALATVFDGDWHWSLRGTPVLGIPAILLILVVMKEPPRGEAEGHGATKATGYREDLKSLACNRSFVLSTLGFTCVTFCAGALAWWAPKYIEDSIISLGLEESERPLALSSVSIIFGSIAMAAGMLGVPFGAFLSTRLVTKVDGRADPIICGVGLIFSSVFILVAFKLAHVNVLTCFILMLLGEIALNLNWSIVADIVLSVVVPTRRGSAEAFQILVSHLLGDAGSPYLIGVISEHLKSTSAFSSEELCMGNEVDPETCEALKNYYSLQYSLMGNIIIMVLGGLCFFLTAAYIKEDKNKVEKYLEMNTECQHRSSKADDCGATINGGVYTSISNGDQLDKVDSLEDEFSQRGIKDDFISRVA